MMLVNGACPMCGYETLALEGGDLVCLRDECPRPTAASEILHDYEIHHRVRLNEDSFNVLHPLHERLDGALMRCRVAEGISEWSGPKYAVGEYRVYNFGEETEQWERIE